MTNNKKNDNMKIKSYLTVVSLCVFIVLIIIGYKVCTAYYDLPQSQSKSVDELKIYFRQSIVHRFILNQIDKMNLIRERINSAFPKKYDFGYYLYGIFLLSLVLLYSIYVIRKVIKLYKSKDSLLNFLLISNLISIQIMLILLIIAMDFYNTNYN